MSNPAVHYDVIDGIAVIAIDNPPVNALGHAVRHGLIAALDRAEADSAVKAIVLGCKGRTFSAGADITEFGKPPRDPGLHEVIERFDNSTKPIVAALFGTTLGGGLELSLGCHFRVATADAKMGLPEVKLGLLPGAGGTQRLPRLIGPEKAVAAIVSGKMIGAKAAHADGLIDAIVADPIPGAIDFAKTMLADGRKLVRVRDRSEKITAAKADPSSFDKAASEATKRLAGVEAPAACVQSVRNAFTLPFEDGLAAERGMFMKLVMGDQSRAQRHVFFAEREAQKIPGMLPEVKAAKISRAVVIGGGTMGGGIAMNFANAGIPVTIIETDEQALTRGLDRVRQTYDVSVKRGALPEGATETRMALFSGTTDWARIAEADIVIEAVFEDMDLKKRIFAKLDAHARQGALLATNTSTLDVDAIAQSTKRPADVLGMHFFSPANVMKLLEIVRGKATSHQAIATAIGIGKTMGKVPVVVGNCDGFVGNRMLARRTTECERLMLEGALPQQIDAVVTRFGFPMGPFAMGDLAGLDVGWRIRKHRGVTAPISDALCEQGRFGQKTGRGYYIYENGSRTPAPDPEVETLIVETAARLGIMRRQIDDDEILERMTYPMINEAARILEEGIAIRPSDIDVVWVYGYGWPVWRGGPCFHADLVGLSKIAERLDHYAKATGDAGLAPSALLRQLAGESKGFADFGKAAKVAAE
ncbi:3-hydroxyacyl-CoA dehydrogenase NAD-binding domain-containing protein [Acidiphilium iwatense]|uniref:3-hydroxyacyl-CoA dehydrogenase NAD-binding domain-containing protein n=1 Tax=Acidiphilium iwatense TaxID=768198 RepID=A0ABS9DX67_9PROT|nr:3-hydroxyacyl-CoA dehydrogenase NAD-binding domain-containing protein [Acidiphilium iwatense]MCF3945914.1 3-hydroxyacyl-CoA dehydrogenase NAD-binding domain-containing protein [Acidiphilium iwatense]